MPLEALRDLLEDETGGVFFIPRHAPPRDVQAAAKRAKFAYFHIEGKHISRKEELLNHVASALHFPSHFGDNWDALEECLTDMEWVDAPGYLIYYDHIDPLLTAHADHFATFIEICRDAVGSWKEDGTPMVVLLSGTQAPKGVAKLKEES